MLTIPNLLTLLNLLLGCTAVALSLHENIPAAFFCIVGACAADFLDGFAARLLRQHSYIGKELDSLADAISFGFSPALMLYVVITPPQFSILYLFPFLLTAFSALRLAKFNTDDRQTTSFIGLPTPANGLFFSALAMLYSNYLQTYVWLTFAVVVLFSYLLVCELPMFSLKMKSISLKKYIVQYAFLLAAVVLLFLFQLKSVPIIVVVYITLSIFLTLFNTLKQK